MTEPTESTAPESDQGVQNTEMSTASPKSDTDVGDDNAEERTPEDKEAARYRHRAKAAEAERDKLAERVAVMQRGEAERLAASKLADPADLWRDGAQLADVLDDAGHIDPTKLDGLIGNVLDAHKHWARQTQPAAAPAREVTSNGKIHTGREPKTWAQVLNPNSADEE